MLLFALPASAQPLTPKAKSSDAKSAPKASESDPSKSADVNPAPSKEVQAAQAVVDTKLLTPLAQKESARIRFSRAARPMSVMRVRVSDPQSKKDSSGHVYMTFAVDSCRGYLRDDNCWQKSYIAGCVYPKSGQVYVQRGNLYFPAEILLGQKAEATANVCQAPSSEMHGA